ncbi:MAG: Rne/Rng family ribonuclease [Proteobacteria bacterium]|nr:MAG: Rne/Rng family ribonuclease [Pseudomonadota bacterium]
MTKTKKLIINATASETRIGLLEGNRLVDLYVERHTKRGMVGNIYKAKISRVLPGMQSAFVNIGADRSAFLYGGDVMDSNQMASMGAQPNQDPRELSNRTPIEKVLREGQEICVQVAKEPLGTKGPRVTMVVTIPGRYLVLMPEFNSLGISRRIEDEAIRKQLTEEVERFRPKEMGIIIRTAALEAPPGHLEKDLKYLLKIWESVAEKRNKCAAPALLYQEPDLVLKTTRDLLSEDVSEIVVDDEQVFNQLKHFLEDSIPGANEKLVHFQGNDLIFDHYGIEMELAKAMSRKVWLPSGGYLVIDQTEALTSFDVNTGKFVGSVNARDTILRTNLEALEEIVYQLRVRNLGGIIVLDFIDMESVEDQQRVNDRLLEALKADKSRTNVLAINELGLVQMTRKRTRESMERVLTVDCAHCNGWGRVLSGESLVYEMVREIERVYLKRKQKDIKIRLRDDIFEKLMNEEKPLYNSLVEKYQLNLQFEPASLKSEMLEESAYEVLG